MARPILPPELEQKIIDSIGKGIISAHFPSFTKDNGVRWTLQALQACSLVCKNWHNHTLQYTFHRADFKFYYADGGLERNAELFRLFEANPSIRRCIRQAKILLRGDVLPENVEILCNAISPIEAFRIDLESYEGDFPLDGLRPILTSPHLRDLTYSAKHLPLVFLADLVNLQSLVLEGVRTVDSYDCNDVAWPSSPLERLDVWRADRVLTHVAAVADSNVGLSTFFGDLKYLHMDFEKDGLYLGSQLHVLLALLRRLETLVVRWGVTGESVPFSISVLPRLKQVYPTFL